MVTQYAELTLTDRSEEVQYVELTLTDGRPSTHNSPWQMGVMVTQYAELTLTDGSEGGPVRRTFGRITDEPRVADQLVTMVTDKTTAAAERMRERCAVPAAMERGSWVRTSGNCNNYSSLIASQFK